MDACTYVHNHVLDDFVFLTVFEFSKFLLQYYLFIFKLKLYRYRCDGSGIKSPRSIR